MGRRGKRPPIDHEAVLRASQKAQITTIITVARKAIMMNA